MRRWMVWNLGTLALCLAAALPARADDLLQFKPLSAESAARIEARNRHAHPARPAAPAPPDTLKPIPPEEATTPTTPLPPSRHAGEMMRIGSDIHVDRDQTVDGDVVAISGDVHVDGHVKGSVQSLGGDVYLSSTARVDGDVAAVKGELHEEPGAYVGGQRVTALSGHVSGSARRHVMEAVYLAGNRSVRELWKFGRTLAWLLIMLGLVWLILRIAPRRTGSAVDVVRRETAASLGIGMMSIVLFVPSLIALALVAAILCVTIIGIPVAVAALLGYFLLLLVLAIWGFVVGAAWLGGQLRGGHPGESLLKHALIGTVLIIGMRTVGHLIAIIPLFGFLGGFLVVMSWILSGTASTLGAGAVLRSEYTSGEIRRWWRNWRGGTPAPAAGPVPGAAGTPPAAGPIATAAPPVAPSTSISYAPPPAENPPSSYAPPAPPDPGTPPTPAL